MVQLATSEDCIFYEDPEGNFVQATLTIQMYQQVHISEQG